MTLPAKVTTVGELKEVLSHLRDDLPVIIFDDCLDPYSVAIMFDEVMKDSTKPTELTEIVVLEIGSRVK